MIARPSLPAVIAAVSFVVLGGCGGSDPKPNPGCTADALVASFTPNNGQNGNMFDVVAVNGVSVNSLTANLYSTATNVTVEIYHRAGTYVGHTTTSGDWTLAGSAVLNGSATGPVEIPVALDIPIAAGQTHAFYVTTTGAASVRYVDGTTVGAIAAEDANIELLEGIGNAYPFGSVFSPRVYIGTIGYTLCP